MIAILVATAQDDDGNLTIDQAERIIQRFQRRNIDAGITKTSQGYKLEYSVNKRTCRVPLHRVRHLAEGGDNVQ